MKTLFLDLETFSEVSIKNGTHAYAEAAEIMLFAWAIDDAPVRVLDLTEDGAHYPIEVIKAFGNPAVEVVAHNSHFDRTVLKHNGHPIRVSRWRDTMVKAMAHSLPASLGELCDVLKLPVDEAKDKDGKKLINLFCSPRPKNCLARRATRETHPAEWARFIEYARLDVEAMRRIDKLLPNWNTRGDELALWHLDQRINDRGVAIDTDLVKSAMRAVDKAKADLAKRTKIMTNGALDSTTQAAALKAHIADEFGYALDNMQMATIQTALDDPELPDDLRELLKVRRSASTSSVAKYKALDKDVSPDGRLRGTLQFCGASRTGRWSGRLFQPQNLPRSTMKQNQIDLGIDAMKDGVEDLLFDDIMSLTSNAIRGAIVAPPGKKLVIADLSNIEGRVLAWLAGESWKLQAFRDFDAGQGHDLYKLAYAKSFGIKPEDVTKDNRQVGKVQELALGYEGGVGAFLTFASAYRIDLEAMGEQAINAIPKKILSEANSALAGTKLNKRDTYGLSDRAWLVCDSFKRSWRYAHPAIVSLWENLENAAITAVINPGVTTVVRDLKIRRDGTWLRIRLPSGRYLCYPGIQLGDGGKLQYTGMNQYSRKWCKLSTYGGKLAENITQAVARDVMAAHMPTIDALGYEIVLSVHDELITETDDTEEFNAVDLSRLMATSPQWAEGLPLAAAGFETYRYRKE